jgi:hypothetical protein
MTKGLGSGRNWGALPLRTDQFEWTMEADGAMVQGPLDMEFLRGQHISLILEEGQYGLLVRNGALKALYLDGAHHLDIGQGNDQIKTDSLLFLLATDKNQDFRWTADSDQGFVTRDGTPVIGRCTVRIEKPARFYHRFLRGLENWLPETITDHLEPLVHQAFNDLLTELCESGCDHAGGLQSSLMNLGAHHLDEYLSEHGLYCVSLAAYTAAPPVENCTHQTAGQSADLLHN